MNVRKQYVEALAHFLESEGLSVDCELEQLATIIMAVMDGLQVQWLLDPDRVSMSEAFDLFSKIVVVYLTS